MAKILKWSRLQASAPATCSSSAVWPAGEPGSSPLRADWSALPDLARVAVAVAGSSSAEDNPVAINVVPMVDVIFCLCLFFMCSLKFKQLEGKIETWLPKDRGVEQTIPDKVVLEEIRVFMRWVDGRTVIKVGNRAPANSDMELMQTILQMSNDYVNIRLEDRNVIGVLNGLEARTGSKILRTQGN